MKKLFALALGLALLSSALIFVPHASRDAYHAYLHQKSLENGKNRRFSEKKFNVTTSFRKKNEYRQSGITRRRQLDSRNNFSNSRKYTADSNTRKLRTHADRKGIYKNDTLSRTGKIVTKPLARLPKNWPTYDAGDFVVEIPKNLEPTHKNGYFQVHKDSGLDIHVAIKKFETKDVCKGSNFYSCARGIIATEKREKEQQYGNSNAQRVEQAMGKYNSTLGERTKNLYFLEANVYSTFDGEEFSTQKVIKGENNELFLIDVRSPKKNAHYTIPFAQRIMETFHVVPTEDRIEE